ncbi:MAG: N-acetyl-gamma-glutamyl-phosphate reductase, partial [Paracoccaceae bacterium]
MAHRVFIDGEAGTTGLQIRDRLQGRADIELISIAPEDRKSLDARLACFEAADVAILCLPDAAAVEIVGQLAGSDTRLIDASTAHRVHDDWVFGFPELGSQRRAAIAGAARVSNPGCYSTCAIALLHPLRQAGILPADVAISINAISGYSGGGKAMVEEFETGASDGHFAYATGQHHKHVPEIMAYGGVQKRPIFVPSVSAYAQGMLVQIPLHLDQGGEAGRVETSPRGHYAEARFVAGVTTPH